MAAAQSECSLLPTAELDAKRARYWEQFIAQYGRRRFSWYGEYTDLNEIFQKYIRPHDAIFVPGASNTKLAEDLYDLLGCRNMMVVDQCNVQIRQAVMRNKTRTGIQFAQRNPSEVPFQSESYAVVVDVGHLDRVMIARSEEAYRDAFGLLQEYKRLLKVGGRCIILSLVREHVLRLLLEFFHLREGWMVRFHRCTAAEDRHEACDLNDIVMPRFAVVVTKFKRLDDTPPPMIEMSNMTQPPKKVMNGAEEVMHAVRRMQDYALFRRAFRGIKHDSEDEVKLQVMVDGVLRYEVVVLDYDGVDVQFEAKPKLKVVIFLVPFGREGTYQYGTRSGRRTLLHGFDCERLLLCYMVPSQSYGKMNEVERELSSYLADFFGSRFLPGMETHFVAETTDVVGNVVCAGRSDVNGAFVVRETVGLTWMRRQLVFLANKHLVQSEIVAKHDVMRDVKSALGKREAPEPKPGNPAFSMNFDYDFFNLSCSNHVGYVGGLGLVRNNRAPLLTCKDPHVTVDQDLPRVLVLGLGGGCLPMFLKCYFPSLVIDVVESDPAMLEIAKAWFAFDDDDLLRVIFAEGVSFLRDRGKIGSELYDAIILDIPNEETGIGVDFPSLSFLTTEVLADVKKCLRPGGVFMLTLMVRSELLRRTIL